MELGNPTPRSTVSKNPLFFAVKRSRTEQDAEEVQSKVDSLEAMAQEVPNPSLKSKEVPPPAFSFHERNNACKKGFSWHASRTASITTSEILYYVLFTGVDGPSVDMFVLGNKMFSPRLTHLNHPEWFEERERI